MLIIAAAQPTCNSWDEQIHFRDSYRIASGHNVEWTEAGLNIMNRINPKCNTKEEYKLLKAYMDEHGTEVVMKETQETSGISYDKIAYIPMAVFLFIGKNLKLPFSAVFALGKFGNLLMYVIVMFGRFALQRAENCCWRLWRCFRRRCFWHRLIRMTALCSRSLHWDVSCGQEKHFSSQRSIIIQLL